MYESPIQITELADNIFKQIVDAKEAYIMTEVKLVVDVDKDELIKALSYDRDQYYKGYADRDSEIVRCKECKHHEDENPGMVYCPIQVGGWVSEDFFCKWGERKVDDT